MTDLSSRAIAVLNAAAAQTKADESRAAARWWRDTPDAQIGNATTPNRPARPEQPSLKAPREMPRRRSTGVRGRIALLHAVAHIELNAIDLAWDLIARFQGVGWPRAFYDDWVAVGDDEARHFTMLRNRLRDLGADYGDLPAHDGLWEAAEDTSNDALARLAIVPMVLEARGLDVTPPMIDRLQRAGDDKSAGLLKQILEEEIVHVRVGRSWFEWLCGERNLDPVTTWRGLVARHFQSGLKPPFNHAAREQAGLASRYLENF
jgi:uncharacterized ferritin-like protein (DUF455 family)